MSQKLTKPETCYDPVIAGGQGRSAESLLSTVECLVILFCTAVGVAVALIILASFPSGAPCLL